MGGREYIEVELGSEGVRKGVRERGSGLPNGVWVLR